MNIAISEPSLFQLTQNLDEPLPSISIGAETLKNHVASIIDLLIEKQLRATVWVKLPQTKSWVDRIQKLQREGNTESIYLCSHNKNYPDKSFLNDDPEKTPVIPLKFDKNLILQRESFLVISSPDFCSLVLAQWQKGKIKMESSGKRLQQPYLEMVSSFEPEVITQVLAEISDRILEGVNTLPRKHFIVNTNIVAQNKLVGELLLKQLNSTETVQKSLNSLSKIDRIPEKSTTVLGLQENFLNNLVQELRSPITHMKTALSLLESKQIKGEQRQRYLQMVSDECDRQNSLVGGLLELLQLDTPIEAEYLHLNEIVPGIVSTYQPLAEEKEIQLGYTIPADIPAISCPRSWFRQIIINLLNNSLRFTPPLGRVFVQAAFKKNNEYVEILVNDTGVGIPSSEINKIFHGFYRTKPTTQEKVTGAGLGLTLVQQLILRCGGSISVTSKVGKGTSFKILMPAVPMELIDN
ncbi:signal transduction histidine kinase [Waterburya agarophytonicola K14]|uniref:histidine kinase n=1 Tax=Waterburya agarophytonicola KI4 TaxID=2874699 RepID=A0A964BS81_9CYAN|nr:ATP-binding protein [Waterburya agarophytonicola]MCC0177578.1 signal transduction histidine kinase [Waterburya agarophytonicola KI4]